MDRLIEAVSLWDTDLLVGIIVFGMILGLIRTFRQAFKDPFGGRW